jgi:hypothetical protein
LKHLFAALGFSTFFAATAYAQDAPNPDAAGVPKIETGGELSADLGIGKIDEDWFVTTRVGFGFQLPVPRVDCPPTECMTALRFGVQVPLRWRVVDNAPENDGTLRAEDWDETSDYFKILRFVEYGKPNEPLHARVGELGPVTVGHGTIVNGYLNVLTPDAFQWGLHTNVNTVYGGAQVLINNFVDPTIVGVRTYVRPWGFIDRDAFMHRLAVGVSVVTDNSAPLELRRDIDGVIAVEAGVAPIVEEETWTTFTGLDVEFNLVETAMLSVTPYTDFNVHWGQSPGYHLGTMVRVAPLESLQLASRLEFRWLGQNYLPDYFGALYEIERYQFTGWGADVAAPKLRIAANRTGGSVVGMYGDLSANILGVATVFGSYADYQGPDNGSIRLRLDLARVGPVKLGAFWAKDGFDSFSEMIDLDGSLLVGEARYYVVGPAYVRADYARTWRLIDDGTYESIDTWNIGGGVAFEF